MEKFKITYWKHNKPNPMSKCFEVIENTILISKTF